MSDISIVSIQYDSLARVFHKLNEAILTIKKNLLQSQEGKTVSRVRDRSPVDEANDTVHNFLKAILEEDQERYIGYSVLVPNELIQHIRKLLRAEPKLEEEIRRLDKRLDPVAAYLDLDDLETFEKILAVVDLDREALFHKLRRKR